ncbi:7-cyano-7-deazaguanine synthase [Pelagimonas phthalicica]|uniref:7-cyano-7-deazaguanine synthase n=1 Tax=Pelagimonas phthalicica TaxID=1037362 RepID=A0A238JEY8_9RHOB|nr:7-cyano-7-deazaguanine synthase QueC [Pelagimonas phthalicica]TDS92167.1 7-cyano-7-deazaguanine synthase [Pelagimonas phthalicica]SMX29228.1 7-cyano-7-deazaguanine synthase [Pelagimonas phthalicica]
MKTLVICSGGLDSVSLAHIIAAQGELSRLVSFDYDQRHKKEVEFAAAAARRLHVPHHIVDIRSIGASLTGSALTDDIDVPDGHYAEDTMKVTVVPNRNAIMLSIAYGIAAAKGDTGVATAVHGGDHFIYPDCRPAFTEAFDTMQCAALDGYADVSLVTPFVHKTKADIVTEGVAANTPFADTWSCYKGGTHHCGRCGTCVERREAFHLAGITDPTQYEDPDFWRAATGTATGTDSHQETA